MGMRNIAAFAAEGLKCGTEGLLNTDWGDGGHRNMLAVSLHNFAYGAAHSWNHRGAREAGFTERFCLHTFGDRSGRLAGAIRTLGAADKALGLSYANGGLLYYLLLHPVSKPLQGWGAESMKKLSAAALAAHAKAVSAIRWPAPAGSRNGFLAARFAEYALASRLDAAACRWLMILKDVQDGRQPAPAGLRSYASQAAALAGEVRRVWLLGNKPSRLREILKGLRRVVRECTRG